MQQKNLSSGTYQKKGKKAGWQGRVFGSNLFTLVLIVLLVASFMRVSKEVLLRYEINKEINELEGRMSELSTKGAEMEELIAYLKTDDYIEEQARIQLNLSRPGEKQINLKTGDTSFNEVEEVDNTTNVIKWFNYFFESK